jgi:NAD(P)-dependent dehydrogenase (short-subunit alcohol dehydrogenase family)
MSGSSRMCELYHPFLTVCQILRTGERVAGDLDRKKGEALPVDAFRLDGKLAVVTGAAQGIGAAIAMTFAAYGAEVAICDRLADGLAETASAITSAGGTVASSEVLDVRDLDAVRAWVATLERVDTLVNNAGGTFHGPFLNVSSNAQRSLIDENFTSVTNFVRECVPKMAPGSTIVNVTSVEAFRGAPGFAVYGAMKAAVEHLSRSLALELSEQGIRVNTIAPDAIKTVGDDDLTVGSRDYGATLAIGWGYPVHCAGAAVFLASSASSLMTGTTIHVDAGSDAARGWRKTDEGWIP